MPFNELHKMFQFAFDVIQPIPDQFHIHFKSCNLTGISCKKKKKVNKFFLTPKILYQLPTELVTLSGGYYVCCRRASQMLIKIIIISFYNFWTYLDCAKTPTTSAYRSATMCIFPVLGPRYLGKERIHYKFKPICDRPN